MTHVVVLSGWSLLLLACLGILGTVVALVLLGRPVDPLVGDMAKLALGFLFGSLPGMVKDLLRT